MSSTGEVILYVPPTLIFFFGGQQSRFARRRPHRLFGQSHYRTMKRFSRTCAALLICTYSGQQSRFERITTPDETVGIPIEFKSLQSVDGRPTVEF